MVLSRDQKHKAYQEAQSILALGRKWQQLVPGEKRPNFERAAAEVIRRALGHKTAQERLHLNIDNSLMHEHGPNEARLVERTLKSNVAHPDVLHSFRDNRRTQKPRPVKFEPGPLPADLQQPELWLQHDSDLDHVSHYIVNSGEFVSHVKDLHVGAPKRVNMTNERAPHGDDRGGSVTKRVFGRKTLFL